MSCRKSHRNEKCPQKWIKFSQLIKCFFLFMAAIWFLSFSFDFGKLPIIQLHLTNRYHIYCIWISYCWTYSLWWAGLLNKWYDCNKNKNFYFKSSKIEHNSKVPLLTTVFYPSVFEWKLKNVEKISRHLDSVLEKLKVRVFCTVFTFRDDGSQISGKEGFIDWKKFLSCWRSWKLMYL